MTWDRLIEMNFCWGAGVFSIGLPQQNSLFGVPQQVVGAPRTGNDMLKLIGTEVTYIIPTKLKIDMHKDVRMHSHCHITI